MSIRSADGKRSAVLSARRVKAAAERAPVETPVVSFRVYGDRRFLSAVQLGAAADRWDIAPSAEEAVLERSVGQPKITSLKAESLDKK